MDESLDTSTTNTQLESLKRALTARDIIAPDDTTLEDELLRAKYAINERRRVTSESELNPIHSSIQIELAIEAISKYGAEGQTAHDENGISRTYDNATPYSQTLLNTIIPSIGLC